MREHDIIREGEDDTSNIHDERACTSERLIRVEDKPWLSGVAEGTTQALSPKIGRVMLQFGRVPFFSFMSSSHVCGFALLLVQSMRNGTIQTDDKATVSGRKSIGHERNVRRTNSIPRDLAMENLFSNRSWTFLAS